MVDSTLTVMMTLFREQRHMAEEWNQGRHARIALKNKPNLVFVCIYISILGNEPLTWHSLQEIQVHTASGAIIKEKRLLLKICSETEQSSIPMMRFNTERMAIWPTASHTLHLLCMLRRLIITESQSSETRTSQQHTRKPSPSIKKKDQLHLR